MLIPPAEGLAAVRAPTYGLLTDDSLSLAKDPTKSPAAEEENLLMLMLLPLLFLSLLLLLLPLPLLLSGL